MTTPIDLDALLSHSAGACDALARRYAATLARMADITKRDGASYGQLLDSASLDWQALHPLARLVADKTDGDEHRVMTYLATCQKLMILQHRDGSLANAQGLMDCKAALADAGGTGWATGMEAALDAAERRLGLAGDHIEGVWSIVHGSVVVDRPACPTATSWETDMAEDAALAEADVQLDLSGDHLKEAWSILWGCVKDIVCCRTTTGRAAALAEAKRRLDLSDGHIKVAWSIVSGPVVVDRPSCQTATLARCVALPVCGACDGAMTASCLYADLLTLLNMLPGSAKLRFVPGCQCCGGPHA